MGQSAAPTIRTKRGLTTATTAACVWHDRPVGKTLASATRRFDTPRTRRDSSRTPRGLLASEMGRVDVMWSANEIKEEFSQ